MFCIGFLTSFERNCDYNMISNVIFISKVCLNLEIITNLQKNMSHLTKNRTQVFPDFANLKMHLTKILSGSIVMIDCLLCCYVYLCVNDESFGSLNVGFI